MQADFFQTDAPQETLPRIEILEDASPSYVPRTTTNARKAGLTVALATDFTTRGELLTRKVAGTKYCAVPFGSDAATAAETIITELKKRRATTLNIAGNGIYTLVPAGFSQAQTNVWLFDILARVHQAVGLTHIRSGGQTGVDMAGLVAGYALGVPVTGLLPKHFLRRMVDHRDVHGTAEAITQEVLEQSAALFIR